MHGVLEQIICLKTASLLVMYHCEYTRDEDSKLFSKVNYRSITPKSILGLSILKNLIVFVEIQTKFLKKIRL